MRYIYITTNTVNGKSYIGQRKTPKGKTPLTDAYLGSGTNLLKDIKKYGKSSFFKIILHECSTQKEADYLEIQEITKRDATNHKKMYYNISKGGQYSRSEEHSEITSEYMKNYYSNDENYINLIITTNRRRYFKKQKPIKYKTLADKDIDILRASLIKKIKEKNQKEKKEIKSLIRKAIRENTVRNNSKACEARWIDRDKAINQLANGRRKAAQQRKEKGIDYWKDSSKKKFALAKLKASNNYICVYLLENGMDNITDIQKNINKMHTKKYKLFSEYFMDQLNLVVLSSNKKVSGMITLPKALELINKHRIQRGLSPID